MRTVFLGTSELGARVLRSLAGSPHRPALVVTQPDRPAGRGRKLRHPPVKDEALAAGLPLIQPEKVNTIAARARIGEERPEVLVVVAFGQILRPKLLALPERGCLNVHASILPRHRGASPIQAQILAGDPEVGVTVMRMDEGLDTGPIGLIARRPALPRETAASLHDDLASMGADLILQALDRLERDELRFAPQDPAAATHAGMIRKSDGRLDPAEDAAALDRRIRAFTPWPGGLIEIGARDDRRRITVTLAEPIEAAGEAGSILEMGPERLVMACGRGALAIHRLKPEARGEMSVRDFLNGQRLPADAVFLRPTEDSGE